MSFTTDFRTPSQLTGIARGTVEGLLETSVVSRFLPFKANESLTYSFSSAADMLPQAARFRSYNTESEVGRTHTSVSHMGELPPISQKLRVDEYSKLKLMGGDIGAEFENLTRTAAANVAARLVLAAGEAIAAGKVTIAERGLAVEIDFGRKSGLNATAGTLWNQPNAKILDDLEALRAVYGANPGAIHMSRKVMNHIATNQDIIKLVVGRGSDLPGRVSEADVRSILGAYGFTEILITDEQLINTAGQKQNVLPDDKVIFLPGGSSFGNAFAAATGTGSLGNIVFGIPAESLDSENGLDKKAGAAAGALKRDDPTGYDVLVSAIALPVLSNANAAASLKVL